MFKNFIDFFEVIKKKNFIEQFTNIQYTTAVSQRFAGNSSQPKDKRNQPTEQELAEAKAGWELLKTEGDKFFNSL